MADKCANCGWDEFDTETGGEPCCTQCGLVMDVGSQLVADQGFSETAGGASERIGQFVSEDSNCLSSSVVSSHQARVPQNSRQTTLRKGAVLIRQLANVMRMNPELVDQAKNVHKLAVEHGLIRGRRTVDVICACLYIVCRKEKTSHLLLDFSDTLKVNPFRLGRTFLKFVELLKLKIPVIDPSLFIHRFAAKLEFAELTQKVAMSALRLTTRMRNDWIHTGRRPTGICGASLIIAARMHGFRRTPAEVAKVVNIGVGTIRRRIKEFSRTASSKQTLREFNNNAIEPQEFSNPPIFDLHRQREKLAAEKKAEEEAKAAEEAKDAKANGLALPPNGATSSSSSSSSSSANANGKAEATDEADSGERKKVKFSLPFRRKGKAALAKSKPKKSAFADDGNLSDDPELDAEADSYILAESETKVKSRTWDVINAEWIAKQKEKAEEAAAEKKRNEELKRVSEQRKDHRLAQRKRMRSRDVLDMSLISEPEISGPSLGMVFGHVRNPSNSSGGAASLADGMDVSDELDINELPADLLMGPPPPQRSNVAAKNIIKTVDSFHSSSSSSSSKHSRKMKDTPADDMPPLLSMEDLDGLPDFDDLLDPSELDSLGGVGDAADDPGDNTERRPAKSRKLRHDAHPGGGESTNSSTAAAAAATAAALFPTPSQPAPPSSKHTPVSHSRASLPTALPAAHSRSTREADSRAADARGLPQRPPAEEVSVARVEDADGDDDVMDGLTMDDLDGFGDLGEDPAAADGAEEEDFGVTDSEADDDEDDAGFDAKAFGFGHQGADEDDYYLDEVS